MKGQPHSGLGSALHDLNVLIFEKNKNVTAIVGAFVILGATIGVFWWEADSKADEIIGESGISSILRFIETGTGASSIPEISGFLEKRETEGAAGECQEKTTITHPIDASELRVIRSINATLTWTDEPDMRRVMKYENQPDEFSLKIVDPTGNVLDEGTGPNPQGSSATLQASRTLSDEEMISYMGKGSFSVEITLNEAGDYASRFGFRTIPDSSNAFTLDVEVIFYDGSSP